MFSLPNPYLARLPVYSTYTGFIYLLVNKSDFHPPYFSALKSCSGFPLSPVQKQQPSAACFIVAWNAIVTCNSILFSLTARSLIFYLYVRHLSGISCPLCLWVISFPTCDCFPRDSLEYNKLRVMCISRVGSLLWTSKERSWTCPVSPRWCWYKIIERKIVAYLFATGQGNCTTDRIQNPGTGYSFFFCCLSREMKILTAPGIPRQSPIQVLTRSNAAWLLR